MPQINCRPDGHPVALHQNRYYSPIVEGEFEFVSFYLHIFKYLCIKLKYMLVGFCEIVR